MIFYDFLLSRSWTRRDWIPMVVVHVLVCIHTFHICWQFGPGHCGARAKAETMQKPSFPVPQYHYFSVPHVSRLSCKRAPVRP